MKKRKNWYLALGIVFAIVAAFSLLTITGILALASPGTLSMTTTQGAVGIALTTSNKGYIYPLSSTARGYTYKWEMKATNTGTLAWSSSDVTVRMGVKGSSVVDKTESGVGGTFKVEQCASGTDVTACREDIGSSGWNLQYYIGTCAAGGTWTTPPFSASVGSVVYGALSAGQSRTACFKLTVPATATDGNYPLITNLLAYSGATYAVASKVDNVAVGGVSGDLTLAMVGLLSIIGSVGAFAFGVKP